MKRVAELRDLSEDHHHGLVLALTAKRTGSGQSDSLVSDVWADIELRFKTELEPHFHIEESLIAPILESRGKTQLVSRLRQEHAVLRDFFVTGSQHTATTLRRWGELLEQHIRFEERELFEVAQETLSREELLAVAEACRARRNG